MLPNIVAKKSIVAVALVFLGISPATAEQNPLQSLVNALGNLAQSAANGGSAANESAPNSDDKSGMIDSSIIGLFEIQSNRAFIDPRDCKGLIEVQNKTLKSELGRGDYLIASGTAESAAGTVAACAVQRYKGKFQNRFDRDLLNLSVAEWAAMIGQRIVTSLQAKKSNRKDLRNTIDSKSASRAKEFLVYAKSNGVSNADAALKALEEILGKEVKVESSASLTGSAESIVEKFNSNTFGFEQKYLGKTIQANGSILTIEGSGRYVNVRILGNKKLSRDEIGFQHEISCIITSSKSMSKAADLTKGRNVTVRGVFDHDQHFNMMADGQVNLSGCEILN